MMKRARAEGPVVLAAAPERGGRLSEGALVEAKVRARLFGIPLLKVEATVVLTPAGTAHASPVRTARSRVVAGDGLAEAVRSINEGAELLAELRRNGSG
jgi:pyridoxal biosynthesis lyase PdxS